VGEDRDRQHDARDEPGSTLSPSYSPGHHDHRDAGDGRERGGRLGDAEGEHRLDFVETTAQGRRRRDDDVNQTFEEDQTARPATYRSLPPLLFQSLHGNGEGVAGRPRTNRRRRAGGRGLHVGVRNNLFEEPFASATRLAGVQSNLHGARRLDLDHAETIDRGEDRRKTESTSAFDDHGSRRSGSGAHAAVEKRECRSRRSADDRAGPTAFGVTAREL
jgi:hypothetical protein